MDARRGRQLHPDGHLSQHNLLLCKLTTSQNNATKVTDTQLFSRVCWRLPHFHEDSAWRRHTYWRQKDKKTLDTHNLPDEDTTISLYAKKEACNIKHKYNILHGQDYAEGILKMNAGFLLDFSISLPYIQSASHDVHKQVKIIHLCLLNTSTTSNNLNTWSI